MQISYTGPNCCKRHIKMAFKPRDCKHTYQRLDVYIVLSLNYTEKDCTFFTLVLIIGQNLSAHYHNWLFHFIV